MLFSRTGDGLCKYHLFVGTSGGVTVSKLD